MRSRIILAVAATLTVAACSTPQSHPAAKPVTLPDGSTANPAQVAYLEQIKPSLTVEHARDVMDSLRLGGDVCRLGMTDKWYITTMQQQEGYDLTEATAIDHAARKHLCGDAAAG